MKRFNNLTLAVVCVAFLAMLLLAGCSGASTTGGSTSTPASTPSAGGVTITEQNFAFNPNAASVKVGDTVTFTNNDTTAHNVKIDGQELGAQNQGESKTWKATKDGTFPFNCVIHPSMTGVITVGVGSGSAPVPGGGTGSSTGGSTTGGSTTGGGTGSTTGGYSY